MDIKRGTIKGGTFSPNLGGLYGELDILRPYGIASTNVDDGQSFGIIDESDTIIVGDNDQERPATKKGEITIYDKWGNKIELTENSTKITSKDGSVITLNDDLHIDAGGTYIEMTSGNVYLGCEKNDTDPDILQVLVDGNKKAENVYAKKSAT